MRFSQNFVGISEKHEAFQNIEKPNKKMTKKGIEPLCRKRNPLAIGKSTHLPRTQRVRRAVQLRPASRVQRLEKADGASAETGEVANHATVSPTIFFTKKLDVMH